MLAHPRVVLCSTLKNNKQANISKPKDNALRKNKQLSFIFLALLYAIFNPALALTITENTTWSGSYTFNEDVDVPIGKTLTIEAGSTIVFGTGKGLNILGGTLNIKGSENSPVIFTATSQIRNSWRGITVEGFEGGISTYLLRGPIKPTSMINYAVIEYAGSAISLDKGAQVSIQNSIMRDSSTGIVINTDSTAHIESVEVYDNGTGIAYLRRGAGGTISSSKIFNNIYGILLKPWSTSDASENPVPTITGNSIYDNRYYNIQSERYSHGNSATTINAKGNWWGTTDIKVIASKIWDYSNNNYSSPMIDFSEILLSEGGEKTTEHIITTSITQDTIWPETGVVIAQKIDIRPNVTLTIPLGAKIEAVQNSKLIVKPEAKLVAKGSELAPIVFTAKVKTKSGWDGITIEKSSTIENVVIDNVILEHGRQGIYVDEGASATISNTTTRYNSVGIAVYRNGYIAASKLHAYENTKGISFYGEGSGGLIQKSTINNNWYGIDIYAAWAKTDGNPPKPIITNNSIYDNMYDNYRADRYQIVTKLTLDATNNWWGTTDETEIAYKIWDFLDTPSNKPTIDFSGYKLAEGVFKDAEGNLYLKLATENGFNYLQLIETANGWQLTKLALTETQWQQLDITLSDLDIEFREMTEDSLIDIKIVDSENNLNIVLENSTHGYFVRTAPLPVRTILFIHTDILGSPVAETDIHGEVQ